ncbi:hypothetical protein F2Q69_00055770 [Brassica cretica]|uniref:thioglucosidase n=1 Tax=Brassica cretica TaxID=69181 RepID=A0A8S9N3H4_BRACR|nr:hypothetical protein F2Q69_00055770 [Brassica cretica]
MNKILMVTIFLALASSGGCGNVYSRKDFPKGFSFGAGASAYQWEGAVDEDGRKPSVWDTFVHSHSIFTGEVARSLARRRTVAEHRTTFCRCSDKDSNI